MQPTGPVYRQVNDRGIVGKFAKALFILVNILLFLMVFGEVRREMNRPSGFGFEDLLGLSMVLLVWLILNGILGTFVWLTRRKRLVTTEDLLTVKRAEKRYRDEEALRTGMLALVAFTLLAVTAAQWRVAIVFGLAGAGYTLFYHRYRRRKAD